MAERFSTVLAFEPEPENYRCLKQNVSGLRAVRAFPMALGDCVAEMGMEPGPDNSGQWHLKGSGNIRVDRLDSFDLPDLDLLKLDVEGYELFALRGAADSLVRFKPVVIVELNGLGLRYGVKDGDVVQYLSALGAHQVARHNKDWIFRWG